MAGVRDFLTSKVFRVAFGPTQPSVQWVGRASPMGRMIWPLTSSSAEVKKAWICTSSPPYVLMACRTTFPLPSNILHDYLFIGNLIFVCLFLRDCLWPNSAGLLISEMFCVVDGPVGEEVMLYVQNAQHSIGRASFCSWKGGCEVAGTLSNQNP